MMLVVSGITALVLYLAQRQLVVNAEQGLEREFQAEVASLHSVQQMHRTALAERCRGLAEKPRIHAALEDNALDLLYPNAKDELRDMMDWKDEGIDQPAGLHTTFCRFLDGRGRGDPTAKREGGGRTQAGGGIPTQPRARSPRTAARLLVAQNR